MSVYRVIDKLEASVKAGTVLPLGYRVVSEEKLLELIEKLRSSLPEEVGRARSIAKNGDRLVREAQEKAQAIVVEASSQSTQLIDDHEIVRRARATAEIVLREAEDKALRVRSGRRRLRRPDPNRPRRPPQRRARLGEERHRRARRRQGPGRRRRPHRRRRWPTRPRNRSAPPSTRRTNTRQRPNSSPSNRHRFGHSRAGIRLSLASGKPGASANDLTDDALLDELTGNAVLHRVRVEVQRVERAPAVARRLHYNVGVNLRFSTKKA